MSGGNEGGRNIVLSKLVPSAQIQVHFRKYGASVLRHLFRFLPEIGMSIKFWVFILNGVIALSISERLRF